MATQFTSPFYLQELAGGLNFPVGAHGFRGPVVWRRPVAGRRGGRKVVFFPWKKHQISYRFIRRAPAARGEMRGGETRAKNVARGFALVSLQITIVNVT